MRIRDVPGDRSSYAQRMEAKRALQRLRERGARSLVFFTAAGYPWASGVRQLPSGKGTLPLDLRDAYARGVWLGRHYGAFVDAWEVDNEPDLIYVRDNPENYAAYLKAMYWGLQRGALQRWRGGAGSWAEDGGPSLRAPRVVMAPLAFPPGPYFAALLENDLLSYTDCFNFHYYGYEEDFPGVYRQFEVAVREHGEKLAIRNPGAGNLATRDLATDFSSLATARPLTSGNRVLARLVRKQLPIVISEYGYGLLSGRTAATREGRVRQWEYFRALAGHMRVLRPEGAMAFVLRPYLEDDAREFGLTTPTREVAPQTELKSSVEVFAHQKPQTDITSGGVTFTVADFDAKAIEPWMRAIGRKFNNNEATPALAWLLHQPPLPESRAWEVVAYPPSPVVIDFVAGEGMLAIKSSRGHFLSRGKDGRATGRGTVVIYHFGRGPLSGVLRVESRAIATLTMKLTLMPGDRREIPVDFNVDMPEFAGTPWRATFESPSVSSSRLRSWVYPDMSGYEERPLADLHQPSTASVRHATVLDQRPLARGEAPLQIRGRWRVTKGVDVEEGTRVWRFTVNGFPDETMRPAMAELPLPDGFRFPRYGLVLANLRLAPRTADAAQPHPEPRSEPEFSALDKETIGVYYRTVQGGLYATTMHFPVTTEWLRFAQIADNFTTVFYGRMHSPWRFLDNEPVALVLMFRPRLLPATYEIRDARIVELVRAGLGGG